MRTKEQILNWVDYMLKSNPCMNVEDRNMFNAIKYYITEKQTDGDLISRDFMKEMGATCIAKRSKTGELVAISSIDNLPSAEKTAEWIYRGNNIICSNCGEKIPYGINNHYCRNCGRRMKEAE